MHQTYTKLIELCYSVLFCVGVTRCRGSWENTSSVAAPPCPPSFYKPPALSLPPLQLLVFLTLFWLTAEQQLLVFLFSPLAGYLKGNTLCCSYSLLLLVSVWYSLVLLVHVGTCWYFWGFLGTFWYFLGHVVTFWDFLVLFGTSWDILELFGFSWQLLSRRLFFCPAACLPPPLSSLPDRWTTKLDFISARQS